VLTTLTHVNECVIRLYVEGVESPLELTPGHRLFSEDRAAWMQACQLIVGENLRTKAGPRRIVSIGAKLGVHRVFNIEVETDHCYCVSSIGVLSHNNGCAQEGPKGGTYKLKDVDGNVERTGRTNDLKRRQGEHRRDSNTKDLEFEVDRRTDDYAAQRGREQDIYDQHPEARVENGGLNKNKPISDRNPKRDEYLEAGRKLDE